MDRGRKDTGLEPKKRGEDMRNKDYKRGIYQQLGTQDGRNETGVRGQEKIDSDSDLMFRITHSDSRNGKKFGSDKEKGSWKTEWKRSMLHRGLTSSAASGRCADKLAE